MSARAVNGSFLGYVLDQLERLRGIEHRAMFGGHGLYVDGAFFAIVHGGRLYFRTDEATRGEYETRGMAPFRPKMKQTLKRYWEVPPEVLDDPVELGRWAMRAARSAPG